MKKKSFFKRLSALALSLVTAFSMMSETIASAAESVFETKHTEYELEYWGYDFRNSGLPNAYDPLLDSPTETSPSTYACKGYFNGSDAKHATDFYYWKDSDGNFSYCVQFQKDNYSSSTMEAFNLKNITKYYTGTQAEHLRFATIYAYKGKTKYGYTWEEELVASQVMVWAISGRYFDSSTTALGTNETKLLNCITCTRSNASTHVANVKACYKKMKADILGHLTIPSNTFDNTDKAEAKPFKLIFNPSSGKWVATIPSNATMKQFELQTAISGVTVTHSGNNLVFTCTTAGAKNLVAETSVTLEKKKSVNGNAIEDCTPVFLVTKSGSTTSQTKVSYSSKYKDADPVEAYAAFEFATGDLNVVKKINENGTLIDATDYEYIYFDENLGTDVKITWDKKYSKNSETGEWDILKTEYNGSQLNIGLRNIIRFKIRTVDNQYIKVTRTGEAGSGSYEFVSFVSTKDEGTEFALSYGLGNEGDAPAGTVVIKGIPAMSPYPYLVEEYTSVYAENFAEYGLTTSVASGSVTANSTATANLVNKLVANGDLTINKVITLSDNTTPSDELYNAVGFKLYDEATQSYASLNLVNAETGTYSVTDFGETEESATTIKLGTTSKTATIQSLNAGDYTVYELNSDNFTAQSDNLAVTMQSTGEQTLTFYNEEKTGIVKAVKTTEGQKNIDGIEFTLKGTSDSGRPIDITATTGADGVATFPSVPIGKYTLSENGETVNTDIYFTADSQEVTVLYEQTATKTFYNEEKTGTVKVVKKTEENKNIEGIEFTLTGTSDSGNAVNLTATTDANGEAYFYDIPVGSGYTLAENGETVKTDIYFTAESQEVTVIYNETTEKEFINLEKTGTVKVVKKTEGQLNISGIEFVLAGTTASGRDITFKATTDENGEAYFVGVPVGQKFTLTENGETVKTDIYFTAESQEVTVIYDETTEKEVVNIEKTGSVRIIKTTAGMINLDGIEFTLKGTSDSGRPIELTAETGADGVATFTGIPLGTYEIFEGEVPYGYLVAEKESVTVVHDETVDVEIFNDEISGTIEVNKLTTGMINLEGVEFFINGGVADNGRVIYAKAVTDANGKATFYETNANFEYILSSDGKKDNLLPIGDYVIIEGEDSVPYGYLVADEQTAKVVANTTTLVSVFNEEKAGQIEVHKTTEGQLNLEGIEFRLEGEADNGRYIYAKGVSDENGIVKFAETNASWEYITCEDMPDFDEHSQLVMNHDNCRDYLIPCGTYTITEVAETTPTAYLTAEPTEVTVVYNETVEKEIYNAEKYGEIKVQKTTEGQLNISGIGFTLTGTSDSGRDITVYATTDENGVCGFEVPIGSYTITEDASTVHFAYLTAEPQNVTVTYSEEATATQIEIYNAEKKGSIKVQKTTEGMTDLEGITFRLSGTSDSGREINAMGVSDVAGVVQFYLTDAEDNIIYDELGEKIDLLPIGSYTITEDASTVPFGYLVADKQEVSVVYNETTETEIVNDTWTGEIYITKTDVSTGDLIPNCKIAILDEDGNVIISDYTDENGEVRFTLGAGTYYYQELEAAAEYVLDTTPHKFEITEEGQIIKAEMTNRKVKSDKPPHTGMSTEQHSDYTFFVLLAFCGVLTIARRKKAN